jgi:asparagine synthase (glutamine-hydrolysing)
MSGLCGWIDNYPSDNSNAALINSSGGSCMADALQQRSHCLSTMAAPLSQFDGSRVQQMIGSVSAVAVASHLDCAHLYKKNGLLIALWGYASLSGQALIPNADINITLGENLARLWRRDGAQACCALSGPFALCILDEDTGEMLLAIDRIGAHSLSFQVSSSGLIFASSADALNAHPAARSDINPQAIYNYLYFHMVPAPETIYQSQQRLLPGECVHYFNGKLERKKYWEMAFHEHENRSFGALKEQFLDTLRGAVRSTTAAPAVVGAFLSGGTDSSTLAAMLGQVSGRAARTYSIGFDAPGYDEMDYARLVSRHFGTEHHELYVTADDVVNAIPKIAAVFDQPFGNASAVPAFYCAQMARADGITRLLGGDGGDELFGGNERYARQAIFAHYQRLPPALRQALVEPLLFKLAARQQHPLLLKARSYVEQALVPLPARLETYNLLQRYGKVQVLENDFLISMNPAVPLNKLTEAYGLSHGYSQINRMLALDMKFTLADNDLPKVVKACELAGIEVAFPFLNDAIVEFSSRLAPYQKLNGTRLRHFFKQALEDTLPRAILRKQKHGFGLPFGHWLTKHRRLKEIAFDSLTALKSRHIVRSDFIDDLLSRHLAQHPGYHGTMVWVLMMLEQWYQQHQQHQR